MEAFHSNRRLYIVVLLLSTFSTLSLSFSPADNYLINCGSTVDSIVDNRRFVAESSDSDSSFSSTPSISLTAKTSPPALPQIYNTASAFDRLSKYEFKVREPGTHMVRLHFHQFSNSVINLDAALFHVLVNGYVVLSNFTAYCPTVKEFIVWLDSDKLVITFVPYSKSHVAFVNAIEVISAPKDLIADTAKFVDGDRIDEINGLGTQALEVMYRINVGGLKVTPFNDTLWRTWIPDEEFLKSGDGSKSNVVHFNGRIKYQAGGVSREVCPDNVYNTARALMAKNNSSPNANIEWVFSAVQGYKYLVRLHFCDIASASLGLLFFNVYVNGNLAYKDLDLSYITRELASPFYADFVVIGDGSGVLSVSVGPSSLSVGYGVDSILNGIEIMKMSNSVGSFYGDLSYEMIMKKCPNRNVGVLIPVVAFLCLLMSVSLVMHRRKVRSKESFGWLKLPVDITDVNPKH